MSASNIPDIIELEPNRVWRTYLGGKMLDVLENKTAAEDTHFPEDWIASSTKAVNLGREEYTTEGISPITINGKEHLLTDLLQEYPNEFLGSNHYIKYGATTQFLLKFLDSSIRLHIQAHPTIAFSQKHLNSNNGKTEAYVILDVRDEIDDAYIYLGMQNPISIEDFKKAVEEQNIKVLESCFEKIPVKPSDVFIVPGGLPHAIGEGVLMVEIMEPTDFTVRLEFEKGGYTLPEGARFMDRGIDFAMSMMNFDKTSVEQIKTNNFCSPRILATQKSSKEFILVDEQQTPCFKVHRLDIIGSYSKQVGSFYVGIVTKGSGTIKTETETISVKKGSRFLVPFSTASVDYISEKPMEVILTFPPE